MYITRATQSAAASSFKRSNFFYLIYFPLASLDRFSSEIADMPALNTWVGLLEREALPPPNITDLRSGEIAAIVLGAVTSVAGILALFKGWKFWKQKKRGATERVSGHDLGHEFVRIDGGVSIVNTTINNHFNSYAVSHIPEVDGGFSRDSTTVPNDLPQLHLTSS